MNRESALSSGKSKKTLNSQNKPALNTDLEVAAWFKQGLALHQQGHWASAQSFYEQVVTRQAQHFDALHLLGLIAAQLHQPAKAVEWITQAIALQPLNAMPYLGFGLALQELKRLDEALESFDKAIALQADHAQAHSCRGDVLLELRRYEEALASFDRALDLQSRYVHAWLSRGSALHMLKRYDEAMASFDEALALEPDCAQACFNRGNVLFDRGRSADALLEFDRAIRFKPSYAQAHFNRGNVLQALERFDEAVVSYEQAIALQPGMAHAYSNRGNALLKSGRLELAVLSYEQAIALKPDFHEVHYNRGNALHLLDRDEEAVASYDQAIALNADYAEAYSNRGNSLQKLHRPQEAVASFEKALAIKPGYAEALYNMGNVLHEVQQWDRAVTSYQQAIALQPELAAFHYNLGNTFKELNRLPEAVASLDRAIALQPEHAESHWNKSLALLLDGQWASGWKNYEWRWKTENAGFKLRPFAQPLWLGNESLQGKTILLYAEQGLGDTVQFCRYASQVKALGATVVLEVQAPLVGVLARLEGVDLCVGRGQPLPDFDFQCPLLSLPLVFRTELHNVPLDQGYLTVDEAKSQAWGLILGVKRTKRVGLVWSGNPLHRNDRRRSLALADLLSQLPPGLEYVSLQKELRDGDRPLLQAHGVRHFGDFMDDFSDTAALCEAMDLVISVDTSVAHLAGALGRPCWVMLPHVPDWRWLLGREDSPWYASVRLYRQDETRSWDKVLPRVAADLSRLSGEDRAASQKPTEPAPGP